MKAGKLSESILKRSVLRQLHNSAVRAPGVGIDFGAVDASAGSRSLLRKPAVHLTRFRKPAFMRH